MGHGYSDQGGTVLDEQAFIRAIIESPDHDLPRLVLADWWDEHGQPERAEFCRVQVELAVLKQTHQECSLKGKREWWRQCETCNRAAALRRREGELLNGHGFAWAGPAAEFIGPPRDWPDHFTRGFVSRVTLPWSLWQAHAAALLAVCPLRGRDSLVRLATWPQVYPGGRRPGGCGWFHPDVPRGHRDPTPPDTGRLTLDLFGLLTDGEPNNPQTPRVRWYDSPEDAIADLRAAMDRSGVHFELPPADGPSDVRAAWPGFVARRAAERLRRG